MAHEGAKTAEKDTIRLTVCIKDHNVDLSLPSKVPLEAIVDDVTQAVVRNLESHGVDTEWLTEPGMRLLIQPLVGVGWNQSRTFDTLDVMNGSAVMLVAKQGNERYPELIESMADASAQIRNERFKEWDTNTSKRFASTIFPVCIAVISIAALFAVNTHQPSLRYIFVSVLGFTAVLLGVTTVNQSKAGSDLRFVASLALATHMLVTVSLALVVPENGVWSIIAGVTGAGVSASVMLMLNVAPTWVHLIFLIPSISIFSGILLFMAYLQWRDAPLSAAAAIVSTIALLIFYREPSVSRAFSKVELPMLPSLGEEAYLNRSANLLDLSKKLSTTGSWEAIVHQRNRNVQARYMGLGVFIGTGIATSLSAIVAAMTAPDTSVRFLFPEINARWITLFSFMVISAILTLRGSWYRDSVLRAAAMLAGAATWMSYILSLTILSTDTDASRMAFALVSALVIVTVSCIWSWSGKRAQTASSLKNLERVEMLLYTLPMLNIAALLNVFFHIRHL